MSADATYPRLVDTSLSIEPAPSPLYLQIYGAITDAIASRALKPGNRLPPERVFCEQFGVSRATVRRALARLAEDGLISATVGRGSFVTGSRIGEPPNALMSFTELAAERGLEATARVLRVVVRPAAPDEATVFNINASQLVFEMERVRLLDGAAVALDRARLPLALAPTLPTHDFSTASVYAVLEESGAAPVHADVTVSAVVASEFQARILGSSAGEALLVCTTLSTDVRSRLVEISTVSYRSDRYQFRAHLARRGAGT